MSQSARFALCRWNGAVAIGLATPCKAGISRGIRAEYLKMLETIAPQSIRADYSVKQCRKRQHLRPLRTAVSWPPPARRVHLGMPPDTGGAGLENPSESQRVSACQPAPPSSGAGWQSVRVLWRTVRGTFGSAGFISSSVKQTLLKWSF